MAEAGDGAVGETTCVRIGFTCVIWASAIAIAITGIGVPLATMAFNMTVVNGKMAAVDTRVAVLGDRYDAQLAEIQADHEETVTRIQMDHEKRVKEIEEKYATNLQDSKQVLSRQMTELIAAFTAKSEAEQRQRWTDAHVDRLVLQGDVYRQSSIPDYEESLEDYMGAAIVCYTTGVESPGLRSHFFSRGDQLVQKIMGSFLAKNRVDTKNSRSSSLKSRFVSLIQLLRCEVLSSPERASWTEVLLAAQPM